MAKLKKIVEIPQEISEGRRHINLKKGERADLARQRQIELAVSLFLDLEQDRTVNQIAAEMGLEVHVLKRLTNDPAFKTIYDEALMSLGHHPRLQAAQANLPDLLPLAHKKMIQLLTRPGVADTAAVSAIKLLYETVDLKKMQIQEDPMQLENFLKSRGVAIGGDMVVNFNLPIPDEYKDAFRRMMRPDTVEGVVRNEDSSAPSNEALAEQAGLLSGPLEEEAPLDEVSS